MILAGNARFLTYFLLCILSDKKYSIREMRFFCECNYFRIRGKGKVQRERTGLMCKMMYTTYKSMSHCSRLHTLNKTGLLF